MTLQAETRKPHVVGNYRFTGKLLGKGNFARVEEAVHNVLSIKVAVKIMDVNQIKEEYVVRNLYREAKLMSMLCHPCIAALYQTMQKSDNVYYLVTEAASGGDLCSFIKSQKSGKLEEKPARIYARQFVSALSHMHGLGVVHRDLKMENVMLNAAQTQIKIVDFGLSNVCSPDKLLRTHCGSPEYAAPELFITGRKYGPEVDLWSLGIILYGMVVGELPFVSNRAEQLSSQERRQKLVAQINKGLGSCHRKALSLLSPEFRGMMNKMLLADSSKRITIKALIVHPWITEMGRKVIKTSPIRKLENDKQSKIVSSIAEMTQNSIDQVVGFIKREPYGRIGGMFNIMAHRYSLTRLNGDGVARGAVPLTIDLVNESKSPYSLKVVTSREGDNPQLKVIKSRPKTVQVDATSVDYRTLKSPTLRRKAYSATITPKTNRPATVSPMAKKVAQSVEAKMTKQIVKKICPEAGDSRKKELSDVLSSIKKLPLVKALRTKQPTGCCREISRVQTAIEKRSRSKSERLPGVRPVTTSGSMAIQRSSKEARILPVVTTLSESKTTNQPCSNARPPSRPGKQRNPSNITHPLEKSALAFGDASDKSPSALKTKKPIIYDPIARSIAGYVVNNVPEKFSNMSCFKK